MSFDKKIVDYTAINVKPNIPTSVDAALIRQVQFDTFENLQTRTIFVNTYVNDIVGGPWGAPDANVVWEKSPQTVLHYDANGGSSSMVDEPANIGVAFKLPQNGFIPPYGSDFVAWAIGSPAGTQAAPGTYYAFDGETTIYALWTHNWDDPVQEGNVLIDGQFFGATQTNNIVEVE